MEFDLTSREQEQVVCALLHILEFVKGNRGSRTGNPYLKKEVDHALTVLTEVGIINDPAADTNLCSFPEDWRGWKPLRRD